MHACVCVRSYHAVALNLLQVVLEALHIGNLCGAIGIHHQQILPPTVDHALSKEAQNEPGHIQAIHLSKQCFLL